MLILFDSFCNCALKLYVRCLIFYLSLLCAHICVFRVRFGAPVHLLVLITQRYIDNLYVFYVLHMSEMDPISKTVIPGCSFYYDTVQPLFLFEQFFNVCFREKTTYLVSLPF
jgi:hypothetical protein